MSWLLPFALLGIVAGVCADKLRLPLKSGLHKAGLLWGGWLLTCLVFFSLAEFYHAYYMIMLAPALGGCVGLGFAALWKLKDSRPLLAGLIFLGAAALTVAFQFYLASLFGAARLWMGLALVALALGAGLLLLVGASLARSRRWAGLVYAAGYGAVLLALVVIPLGWSALTVFSARADVNLPSAYAGELPNPDGRGDDRPQDGRPLDGQPASGAPAAPGLLPGTGAGDDRPGSPPQSFLPGQDDRPGQIGRYPQPGAANLPGPGGPEAQLGPAMLAYLQEHTQDVEYLVAAPSSHTGASLVLQTGRAVLYMGGFGGGDPVIDAAGLQQMVENGELRFVLWGGLNNPNQQQILRWLRASCSLVDEFSAAPPQPGANNRGGQALYLCQPADQ